MVLQKDVTKVVVRKHIEHFYKLFDFDLEIHTWNCSLYNLNIKIIIDEIIDVFL